MAKTRFTDIMREIEAEAVAEGPEAVEELEALRDYFRLAREVAAARKQRGLSQRQLADRCGVHQSEISDIERGEANPTYRTLQSIARGLGSRFRLVTSAIRRRQPRAAKPRPSAAGHDRARGRLRRRS